MSGEVERVEIRKKEDIDFRVFLEKRVFVVYLFFRLEVVFVGKFWVGL